MFDLGIDVGGTNTDVVLLTRENEGISLRKSLKTPTTRDVMSGVVTGTRQILEGENEELASQISNIFLGTTQFVNAVVERSAELSKVAVVRLAGDATDSIAPFSTLPDDLRERVEGPHYYVKGGYDFLGKEFYPLDRAALEQVGESISKLSDVNDVVVVGMFSSTCPSQEEEAARILEKNLPAGKRITQSHQVGEHNLILREHAAIMNASLRRLAMRVVRGFVTAFKEEVKLPNAKVFLTQNDGTLLPLTDALHFPIKTLGCGPTNSMRGAALLCAGQQGIDSQQELFVCDIGGTTSDIGIVEPGGFPRLCNVGTTVGGVKLNSRFPDTVSVALGGGTIIDVENETVGVASVGYRLTTEARVFGGGTTTATDVAVAAGHMSLGNRDLATAVLSKTQAAKFIEMFVDKIARTIALLKTKPGDVTLVLCGGGASLLPHNVQIPGVHCVVIPKNAGVANAVGAALAQVGADIDTTEDLTSCTRDEVSAIVKERLINNCVANGAQKGKVHIFSFADSQLAYIENFPARRFFGRAIGPIDFARIGTLAHVPDIAEDDKELRPPTDFVPTRALSRTLVHGLSATELAPDPSVNADGVWTLTMADVELIAEGNGVLGTGGGGNTYHTTHRLRNALSEGRIIQVIAPRGLKDDSLVLPVGFIGAPTVVMEMIGNGREMARATEHCEKLFGRQATALMSIEIGGMNGMEPLYCGAVRGILVVDADGMGRAFPFVSHYLPLHLPDGKGVCVTAGIRTEPTSFEYTEDLTALENNVRKYVVEVHGAVCAITMPMLTKDKLERGAVLHSVSLAWRIGRCLHNARVKKQDPVQQVAALLEGTIVFRGTIVDVLREVSGFSGGHFKIETAGHSSTAIVKYLNENLACLVDDKVVATSPDLISLVDNDTGRAIFVDEVKMGLRVAVLISPGVAGYRSGEPFRLTTPTHLGIGDLPTTLTAQPRPAGVSICDEFKA